jgi:mono/diheme cytochrome c family protein
LETRARAYLDVNCAHCHRTGGVGGRAAFQLLDSLPLAKTGVIRGTPLVPLLGSGAAIVQPGHPERSELMHRLMLTSGGRMPLVGSELPDTEGIDLIRQWIRAMTQ